MAPETFGNKVDTTVASGYTAGSGTLVVASATGMPATGNFRIRLGNVAGSILRVTARAGTTLTLLPSTPAESTLTRVVTNCAFDRSATKIAIDRVQVA